MSARPATTPASRSCPTGWTRPSGSSRCGSWSRASAPPSGASRLARRSGARACSWTARAWSSTLRSTRSSTHRLEARAAILNGRGNGALRKIGAMQEGILRKSFLRNGEYLDQALWTILDEDWRAAARDLGRSHSLSCSRQLTVSTSYALRRARLTAAPVLSRGASSTSRRPDFRRRLVVPFPPVNLRSVFPPMPTPFNGRRGRSRPPFGQRPALDRGGPRRRRRARHQRRGGAARRRRGGPRRRGGAAGSAGRSHPHRREPAASRRARRSRRRGARPRPRAPTPCSSGRRRCIARTSPWPALIAHYTAVADASPVPVLLYNYAAFTGVNMAPETVGRLAAHPNIIGMKETSTDGAQFADLGGRGARAVHACWPARRPGPTRRSARAPRARSSRSPACGPTLCLELLALVADGRYARGARHPAAAHAARPRGHDRVRHRRAEGRAWTSAASTAAIRARRSGRSPPDAMEKIRTLLDAAD